MKSEKIIKDMRNNLSDLTTQVPPKEYRMYLATTIAALNWVLGE